MSKIKKELKKRNKELKKIEETKKEVVKELSSMIMDILKASREERMLIYKIRLEHIISPQSFDVSIAFSKESKAYFLCSYHDNFIKSERVLRCGDTEIRNVPLIIDRITRLENTLFLEEISNEVRKKFQKKKKYCSVSETQKGFEIIFL